MLVFGGGMLKAVLFDIDGTLVDSVDIHAMA
jgi:beta-phosphoglucomutase-like phosphatase (HAD superfamily)